MAMVAVMAVAVFMVLVMVKGMVSMRVCVCTRVRMRSWSNVKGGIISKIYIAVRVYLTSQMCGVHQARYNQVQG